jgi:hypothetical protein
VWVDRRNLLRREPIDWHQALIASAPQDTTIQQKEKHDGTNRPR